MQMTDFEKILDIFQKNKIKYTTINGNNGQIFIEFGDIKYFECGSFVSGFTFKDGELIEAGIDFTYD